MTRNEINLRLQEKEDSILIMAHRGVCGANIVDNTMESFELALKQGADILEMDVFRSTDGKLYVFHDGTEPFMLGTNQNVKDMTSEEILQLRFLNKNGFRLERQIPLLEDVLEQLKGRCLINLDRCWWCWPDVFRMVEQHKMEDQIIFKSAPTEQYLSCIAAQKVPFMYMPIIWYPEELERVDRRLVNMVAVEFIGHSEDAEIMKRDFIRKLRQEGIFCMISALSLANPLYDADNMKKLCQERGARLSIVNGNIYLAAGHDDDISLLDSPEKGWGWLIDAGFNMIQTDWTRELSLYLKDRKAGGVN